MTPHAVDAAQLVRELRTTENILTLAESHHEALPPEVRRVINQHAGWGERLRLVQAYAGLSLQTIHEFQHVVGQLLMLVGEEPVSSPRRPDLRVVGGSSELWRP